MQFKVYFIASWCLTLNLFADMAPGKPGIVHTWANAKKENVGTAIHSPKSLVWFSNADGILTETYFPTIDKAQIKDSQLLVSDGISYFAEEKKMKHQVSVESSSKVNFKNFDDRVEINREYFTLSEQSVLVEKVRIDLKRDGLKVYLLTNPAMANTGRSDTAQVVGRHFEVKEGSYNLSVGVSPGFRKMSVGYVGTSDGYQDLSQDYVMDNSYIEAVKGNVALTGEIDIPAKQGSYHFFVYYSFEPQIPTNVRMIESEYLKFHENWNSYLASLKYPKAGVEELRLYKRSLYTLKVHEDKLNPGAMIASLSNPWGEDHKESDTENGGYHLIWPRDLYHVSSALIQAGDYETPLNALRFLKKIQYKAGVWDYGDRKIKKRGAFPQNTWTDGREYWGGFQLDQVGYPVHLFYQLWSEGGRSRKVLYEFEDMILSALEFISQNGPWSGQERWEENFGISPSSFSVAASALILGAKIFDKPEFLNTAKSWLHKPNDNIHTWTYTTSGVYGDGQYYIRVGGCDGFTSGWDPNKDVECQIANSWDKKNQKDILDQGFLKLALLGLVPASNDLVKSSLEKVNNHLRVQTPNGFGWYRYSYDAYGEDKRGRLWPLLSSEHARYAIERYSDSDLAWADALKTINPILDSYLGFANTGLMIPEQVFEDSGEGTGGATPLAWSHGEFIKTLWSKHHRRNVSNLVEN